MVTLSDAGSDDESIFDDEYDLRRFPSDIQTRIWCALRKVRPPSAFTAGGHMTSYINPGLHIKNYGTVGLPLSDRDAKAIINEAERSPFGKGEHTIIDTSVRNSWELDAREVSSRNPAWSGQIQQCLNSVCETLGLNEIVQSITAEPYKLLLYEPGAFFKSHRDSEKSPGMFGTVIICLPSKHEGGDIRLEHAGEKYKFETEGTSEFGLSYAAWYSDVSHEIMQVTSGYRLVLTYNLVEKPGHGISQAPLNAPDFSARKAKLSGLLTEYGDGVKQGHKLPPFLVHDLDYKYTQAGLKEASLKGSDVSVLRILKQLSKHSKIDLYLATVELMVVRDDEGDGEEIERHEFLSLVVELDGSVIGRNLELHDPVMANTYPQSCDKDQDADEVEKEGYTGNVGATATCWYRRSVIVIVPHASALKFVCSWGINPSKPMLLLRHLIQGYSSDLNQRQDALQLCKHAIENPPGELRSVYHVKGEEGEMFLKEAVAAALTLDSFELFQKACHTTAGAAALLANAECLGAAVRKNGLKQMRIYLEKGVEATKDMGACCKFLADVEAGIQSPTSADDGQLITDYRYWSEQVLQSAASRLRPLTRSDGGALADMSKTRHWPTFDKTILHILTYDQTLGRIAFLDSFLRSNPEMGKPQLDLAQQIIRLIWTHFEYTCLTSKYNLHTVTDFLDANDLRILVESSQCLLEASDLEELMIPILLVAITSASPMACEHVFPELIKVIAEDKFHPTTVKNGSCPPDMLKELERSLLTNYIKVFVGSCPHRPSNRALPRGRCTCGDCFHINNFLADPVKTVLDFPCSNARRHHLHTVFTNVGNKSYKVETIWSKNSNIWRITKHNGGYEQSKSQWIARWQTAHKLMKTITEDPEQKARLEELLSPHFDAFMSLRVHRLPTIGSTSSAPLATISLNADKALHKRGLSEASALPQVDKRLKTSPDQCENSKVTKAEAEIVDLTEL